MNDTSQSLQIQAQEKTMEIVEKIDEVKEELDIVNRDSQNKFDIILNELEEIKIWKEKKEIEEKELQEKNDETEYNESEINDESDDDIEIDEESDDDIEINNDTEDVNDEMTVDYESEDDDEMTIDYESEMGDEQIEDLKFQWYKYSERIIPEKYKSNYVHNYTERTLIESWYNDCIKI